MITKFTKGKWYAVDYAGDINIQDGETYEDKNILSYDSIFPGEDYSVSKEEVEANVKLILAAQELFYTVVLDANDTGAACLFNRICAATGIEFKYGSPEFEELVKEANEFFKSEA